MAFFLLKWVFNHIGQEGADGLLFVQKEELVGQLIENRELLAALNYSGQKELEKNLDLFKSQDPELLTWQEFLNFFFIKDRQWDSLDRLDKQAQDWWVKLDPDGRQIQVNEQTPPAGEAFEVQGTNTRR